MIRFHSICLSLLIVMAAMSAMKPAQASCNATVSALDFGSINPITPGVQDVSATVTYNCSAVLTLISYIYVCIEIGPGPQDNSIENRVLTHVTTSSDHLSYNVYSDPARTSVFGNQYGSASPPVMIYHGRYLIGVNPTVNGSQTVYGRMATNPFMQRSVGQYNSSLAVTVRISALPILNLLSCADPSPAVVQMPILAEVKSACNITAWPLNFGSHPSNFTSSVQATTEIDSSCTKNTPYQIGLSNGLHANGTQRRMMAGTGQYINYELYKNASRSQRWGSALNTTETLAGTATGVSQRTTVYGEVSPQAGLESADYKDTVVVTITY